MFHVERPSVLDFGNISQRKRISVAEDILRSPVEDDNISVASAFSQRSDGEDEDGFGVSFRLILFLFFLLISQLFEHSVCWLAPGYLGIAVMEAFLILVFFKIYCLSKKYSLKPKAGP